MTSTILFAVCGQPALSVMVYGCINQKLRCMLQLLDSPTHCGSIPSLTPLTKLKCTPHGLSILRKYLNTVKWLKPSKQTSIHRIKLHYLHSPTHIYRQFRFILPTLILPTKDRFVSFCLLRIDLSHFAYSHFAY